MEPLLPELTDKDDAKAFARTKEISAVSAFSPEYYPYLEEFASLLRDKRSYVRVRACILCCSQARWDTEGRIKDILPELTALLNDPKPTVVRQCLNAIREVAVFRPELSGEIQSRLAAIDLSRYKASMVPLIEKDVLAVTELLDHR